MSSDKTKAELEAENEELRNQLENAMTKCPNCGFDPIEHEELVKNTIPA